MQPAPCNILQSHAIFLDKHVASCAIGDLPLTAELTNILFWADRVNQKSGLTLNHSLQAGCWRLILPPGPSPLWFQIRQEIGAWSTSSCDKSLTEDVLDWVRSNRPESLRGAQVGYWPFYFSLRPTTLSTYILLITLHVCFPKTWLQNELGATGHLKSIVVQGCHNWMVRRDIIEGDVS